MKLPLAAAAALIATSAAAASASEGSPFRYDDDPTVFAANDDLYSRLKYHPLGGESYLSLGADLRERVEASDTTFLGLQSRASQTYDLHRLLVFADFQADRDVRVFVQLGNHDEIRRNPGPSPLDVDRLDLSQAFVDLSHAIAGGRATLRLGRAEMSFDDGALIGLRDGPNVRQSWDGARLTYAGGPLHLDLFAVRPVAVEPGVFDDGRVAGQFLGGVHVTFAPSPAAAVDGFYYHNVNPPPGSRGRAPPSPPLGSRSSRRDGAPTRAQLALWWLYFADTVERAGARFKEAADVGAVARMAYTYLLVLIIAGIIAFAAGVERLMADPAGPSTWATSLLIGGGPMLYLIGLASFRLATGIGVAKADWAAICALGVSIDTAACFSRSPLRPELRCF